MLPNGTTPIRPITGRRSLFLTSSARCAVPFPCGQDTGKEMPGRNGFTQLMIEEMRAGEVGVCSPVGIMDVAANPSLWQTTPQCHPFDKLRASLATAFIVFFTTSLLRRLRLTRCTTLHICSTVRLSLPKPSNPSLDRSHREAGRLWPLSPGLRTSPLPEMHAWVGTPEHHRAYFS